MGNNDTFAASINIPSSQICNTTKEPKYGSGYSGSDVYGSAEPEYVYDDFYFEDTFFSIELNINCNENASSSNGTGQIKNSAVGTCEYYDYLYLDNDYLDDYEYMSDECTMQQKLDQGRHESIVHTQTSLSPRMP